MAFQVHYCKQPVPGITMLPPCPPVAALPLLAGRNIDAGFIVPAVASCIDLVVHCELRRGRRRVVEILAPTGAAPNGIVEFGHEQPSKRRGTGFAGPLACLASRMTARRGHSSARPSRRRSAWSRGPRPPREG